MGKQLEDRRIIDSPGIKGYVGRRQNEVEENG